MSKDAAKDFGPIVDDYAFFEQQSTEQENDARAHLARLKSIVPKSGPLQMLDFGGGSGKFTERFLQYAAWPAERLHLTLVEPVEKWRKLAAARLAHFTNRAVADFAALPEEAHSAFDVVLANHSLYYVPDLRGQLAKLIAALTSNGAMVAAIASRSNALVQLWITAFGLLGKEVPHHTSEDVAAALQQLGAKYSKESVPYDLTFPDTEENRMKIVRFLLADYLDQLPHGPLLESFNRYAHGGQIEIRTGSDHYTVRGTA